MKVTIEGDLEQVVGAMPSLGAPISRKIRIQQKREMRARFTERRGMVRRAFERVRYIEAERLTSNALLDALRRTTGVTDDDILMARRVLGGLTHTG